MKIIHEIEITEFVLGRNVYNAGNITVNWDHRSFMLKDYVEFRIFLVGTTDEGEETRRDVTNEYMLSVPAIQGHSCNDGTQITFNEVNVTYTKKMHIKDWRETACK